MKKMIIGISVVGVIVIIFGIGIIGSPSESLPGPISQEIPTIVQENVIPSTTLSRDSQIKKEKLIKKIRDQSGIAFDQNMAARLGKMLGAHYVTYGKIVGETEQGANGNKRTQYRIYIEMVDVETSKLIVMEDAFIQKNLKKTPWWKFW